MKIYTQDTNLDIGLLKNEFEIVDSFKKADYAIVQSTVDSSIDDLSRCVYIAYEPPLSGHRRECFKNFPKFHTVVTYDPKRSNEFPFAENTIYFPANYDSHPNITRSDLTLNNGIYYSGCKSPGYYKIDTSEFNCINMKKIRDDIASYLIGNHSFSIIRGIGWSSSSKDLNNGFWRITKQEEITANNPSFHLCIENAIMNNLISERILDGFISDRCILYLGDPNIKNKVPSNCFINLMHFFDGKTFDTKGMLELINNITQEEYNKIIYNARKFRTNFNGKHEYYSKQLTKFIINRLKHE